MEMIAWAVAAGALVWAICERKRAKDWQEFSASWERSSDNWQDEAEDWRDKYIARVENANADSDEDDADAWKRFRRN